MNVPSSLALSCSAHHTDLALSCGTNTLSLSLALSPGADPPALSPGAHPLPLAPTTRFPDSFTQPRSTSCFSPALLHAAPPTPRLWCPHCPCPIAHPTFPVPCLFHQPLCQTLDHITLSLELCTFMFSSCFWPQESHPAWLGWAKPPASLPSLCVALLIPLWETGQEQGQTNAC